MLTGEQNMAEDKKEDKQSNSKSTNLKIFGIDICDLIKNWANTDGNTYIETPEEIEKIKTKIEDQKQKLQNTQNQLKEKYGDAVRFEYDVRISSLTGAKDIHIGDGKRFQNRNKPTQPKYRQTPVMRIETPKEQENREPLSDILDREGYLFVIIELPGVNEQNIKIKINDQKISILAETISRKYNTEIDLPTKVAPTPVEQTYKNGVLEIKLKKENE